MKHLTSWTNSTDWLDDYSDGQSKKRYTVQWSQNPSDMTVASYADFIYSSSEASEAQSRLTIAVAAERNATVFARFIGCVLVGSMPDQGLSEALNSLSGMWKFYTEELERPRVTRRLPQRVEATVAEYRKRRDMVISK